MAIGDLEMLLETDALRVMPGGRLISDLLKECAAALAGRDDFVVSGRLARGVYAQAQFTGDLEFLTRGEGRAGLIACLTAIGLMVSEQQTHDVLLEDPASRACVRLRLARTELEHRAIDAPAHHLLLGSRVRFIAKEFWLWLLCRSDERDDRLCAEALLLGGQIDLAGIKALMTAAADQAALDRLDERLPAADRARLSTYSKSMQRRLARRLPGMRPMPVWRIALCQNNTS